MQRKILQFISNFFHPLLSMIWATILLVHFTPLKMLPVGHRWYLVGQVAFYSMIVPSLVILLLSMFGIVKNGVALRDRKDRIIPLGTQVLTYAIQAAVLQSQGLPFWATQFLKGAFLLALVAFVVSFWWKISAHAAGNAALATSMLILYSRFPMLMPLWLPLLLIVLAGLVCSCRLYLGRHTLGQIGAGALAGAVCMLLGGLI
ncbi:MAG: hypothetical protein J6P82_01230 [Bacteroidales bacterium]|jgi:membrane-associated phospholipid phosphatase|nr:hypothetical protein [Bacteroidales bacterium]MBO7379681.1 hypothetical protein [Bacteroidales bacterium]MBP5214519.1 hypothetical protein [Bacteroidales bacterium]MBP5764046.1 hypothetical protein [Bacteroidales bacterium]